MTVVNLIDKSDNCKHWSVQDALQDAITRINGKNVKQGIALWYEEDEKGRRSLRFSAAGVNNDEHITMLSVFLAAAMDDLRGKTDGT